MATGPVRLRTGRNSPRVGPHSSPDKLEEAARRRGENASGRGGLTSKHGSPPAFQIPRRGGDEDEGGAVALEDNLRRTPRGVWVQKTVHRLEPAGERGEETGSGLEFGNGEAERSSRKPRRRPHLDGSSSREKAPFKLMMLLLFSNIP